MYLSTLKIFCQCWEARSYFYLYHLPFTLRWSSNFLLWWCPLYEADSALNIFKKISLFLFMCFNLSSDFMCTKDIIRTLSYWSQYLPCGQVILAVLLYFFTCFFFCVFTLYTVYSLSILTSVATKELLIKPTIEHMNVVAKISNFWGINSKQWKWEVARLLPTCPSSLQESWTRCPLKVQP